MKNNSTLLHLGLIIMVLITSCNDKLDVTQDNVRGKITNYIDGTPITNELVRLRESGSLATGDTYETYTNTQGEFEFIQDRLSGYDLQIPNLNGYQMSFFLNGELTPLENSTSGSLLVTTGTDELNIELYPTTIANITFTNTPPSSETDTITIDFENVDILASLLFPFEPVFTGADVDTLLSVELLSQNVITINYDVITDSGIEEFSETFECEPGGVTDIEIEY